MSTAIDNRYLPVSSLGEGAMGAVWLADDQVAGRQVALKVVSAKLGTSDKSVLQFKQEFRLMTQLRHPHCCTVYDYGQTADGQPYFTMEVVPGHGLDELLPLDEATFRRVFAQLMLALGYIHGLGLVHGDLKSANVRVKPDGSVKLMDFGLMDYAGRIGAIRGTPAYMAPEVIKRAPVDRRSDLYSAGCLAYELLTGVLPFGGTQETVTTMQLLRQHVAEQPLALDTYRPGLSPELGELIMKLLAKDPLDRCQSAGEVLEALGAEVPAGIGGALLTSPLFGRAEALSTLTGAIASAAGKSREGGSLLVHGPAGIGKSRLLDELRTLAQLEGVPCFAGACFEQDTPPYGPFLLALRQMASAMREQLPKELWAVHAPVLVKLVPELDPDGSLPPAPDLENPKSEMMRMQAAIAHVLAALAAARPYTLLLENWQWADALSQDLLDYLLRNMAGAPMVAIVTSRDVPAGRAIAASPTVALAGLGTEELRRMVGSMLGTPRLDERFLARVEAFSAGNPFMVERLLEHLVQTHVLVNTYGRWNTADALTHYELPMGLQAVLGRTFDALTPAAQRVAHMAAVLGRRCGMAFLQRVTGLAEEPFLDALDRLQQGQLLLQDEAGGLHFAQDQFAEMLAMHLDPGAKAELHARLAEALVADLDGPLEEAALETVTAIARHALAGKLEAPRALRYALEAAERSRAQNAMGDAERLARAGLALLDRSADDLPELRLGLTTCLGDVLRQTGRAADARTQLEAALALAEASGTRPLGRLLGSVGKAQQMAQAFDAALGTLERAVARSLAEHDPTGAARSRMATARVHLFQAAPQKALEDADAALALAEEAEDPTELGRAHALIGYLIVAAASSRLDEGVAHLEKSLALLGDAGDPLALSTSYQLLGNAQLVLGEFAGAQASFAANKRIAFEIASREEEAFACINLGIVAWETGDFQRALAWAREARDKVATLSARFPQAMAQVVEADALALVGDEARARALSAEALATARTIKNAYLEGLALAHRCEVLAYLGRLDEARAEAEALTALMARTGNEEPRGRLAVLQSRLHLRKNELDAARAAAEQALAIARSGRARPLEVRAMEALARQAHASGDFPAALARGGEALALARQLGMRFLAAELLGLLGEASLALGNGQAGGHFDAMAELARELGSPPLDAQARFGQAASRPYEGGSERAQEARTILEAWLERMTPEGRAAFPAYPERRRILDGNHIGFSLPLRSRQNDRRDTRPLRLGMLGTGEI